MNGQKPSRPTSESPACRDYGLTNRVWNVMDRCWESNPQDRLDAHGIIDELQINYLIDSRLSGWQDAIPPSVFRAAIHGTVDDLPADEMEIIISLVSLPSLLRIELIIVFLRSQNIPIFRNCKLYVTL